MIKIKRNIKLIKTMLNEHRNKCINGTESPEIGIWFLRWTSNSGETIITETTN